MCQVDMACDVTLNQGVGPVLGCVPSHTDVDGSFER